MPFVVLRGTYSVDGPNLTVRILGQPEGTYPYRIENGQLPIKNKEGLERAYKRSESKLCAGTRRGRVVSPERSATTFSDRVRHDRARAVILRSAATKDPRLDAPWMPWDSPPAQGLPVTGSFAIAQDDGW